MRNIDQLIKEWNPVLSAEGIDPIKNREVLEATAQILENNQNHAIGQQRRQLNEDEGNVTANMAGYDPVLISMVRRTMPSLIAFDLAGVQPMNSPTGKVFAMRVFYGNDPDTGTEAFYNQAPDTSHTGKYTTSQAENLGTVQEVDASGGSANARVVAANPWPEMSMKIESVTVTAQSRAIKATYSDELMDDLRNLHGLNADTEISRMLVGEIRAEMNRELTDTINTQAVTGAQGTTTPGTFDMDVDTTGRWQAEKHKELLTFIYREAAIIARDTRRGQGNFIITSADVAAALIENSRLDLDTLTQNLSFDGIGVTFAGVLSGRFKLYIDAYAASNYVTIGYKGVEKYDAGLFWCPYVGIERKSTIKDNDFQPQIGYKTRYGIVANPLTSGAADSNVYFRRFEVTNL